MAARQASFTLADMQLDELLGPDKSEGSSSSEDWEDVAADGKGQPSPGTANRQVGQPIPALLHSCRTV